MALVAARNPPNRDEVVARLDAYLSKYSAGGSFELAAVYLYGSVARGEARLGSDVDVAVLFRETPPSTLEGIPALLEAELARAVGARVELLVLNRAPVDLVQRVLRDGILLLDRDRSLRIAFEVAARNRYWDLLPILRRYRKAQGAT
jgi:predicted nucleotidyltransferase